MNLSKSFSLISAVATAATLSTEEQRGLNGVDYSGNQYFNNPGYNYPDYQHEYNEPLPGADFNKQVYGFQEDVPIWSQHDYEERVRVEAQILVSLEALKSNLMYLGYDINGLKDAIFQQRSRIGVSRDGIKINAEDIAKNAKLTQNRLTHL